MFFQLASSEILPTSWH